MQYCLICGKPIRKDEKYHTVADGFVCSNNVCFQHYYWKLISERIKNKVSEHEYAIIDGHCYLIGNKKDESRGSNGREFHIAFRDGTKITTNSLWLIGEVPFSWVSSLPDNAFFE